MGILASPTPSRWVLTATALAGLTFSAIAQERDRAKIPDRYKWNLAGHLSVRRSVARREGQARGANCRSSANTRASSRRRRRRSPTRSTSSTTFDKELSRLYVYASMLADQDTRDSTHQGMQQEMVQLASTFSATASFIEPEILKANKATIERYIAVRAAAEGLSRSI